MLRKFVFTSLAIVAFTPSAFAAHPTCAGLPDHAALVTALKAARAESNGGLNNDMWGTIVDRAGIVCAVAFTGTDTGAQWPGSRAISAQKANTANAFSVDGFALSTANLYAATQPGGSLFGLQESNPLNKEAAYRGAFDTYGTVKDPMVGAVIGGVNVFGGGLALYNTEGKIVGAVGVSGDTSCADHNIAWRTRNALKLDHVSNGVGNNKSDQIVYDMSNGKSTGGFGHPTCGGTEVDVAKTLAEKTAVVTPEKK